MTRRVSGRLRSWLLVVDQKGLEGHVPGERVAWETNVKTVESPRGNEREAATVDESFRCDAMGCIWARRQERGERDGKGIRSGIRSRSRTSRNLQTSPRERRDTREAEKQRSREASA